MLLVKVQQLNMMAHLVKVGIATLTLNLTITWALVAEADMVEEVHLTQILVNLVAQIQTLLVLAVHHMVGVSH